MSYVFDLLRKNGMTYTRWCWCIAAAISLLAWARGGSAWAGVAAFNALAVVWNLTPPRAP